jgi:uroporphyrinogen decarboxylase
MVEGGVSQRYYWIKSMIYSAPEIFHSLMKKVAEYATDLLRTQIRAGANAVMLFESWGGVLTRREYLDFAYPYATQVISKLRLETVPIIYFVDKGGALLEDIKDSGADVIQVDFRTDLDTAINRLGLSVAVQGNLDPFILLSAPRAFMRERVKEILEMGRAAKGHVFNLGDGIQPETPVDHSKALVDAVHELSRR